MGPSRMRRLSLSLYLTLHAPKSRPPNVIFGAGAVSHDENDDDDDENEDENEENDGNESAAK